MKEKAQSTKLFDNYSVAIRQWKAQHSHCKLLHGYSFEFKVVFEHVNSDNLPWVEQLDEMNWITDYGIFSRNGLKEWMNDMFDHTTIIEKDDPQLESFRYMEELGLLKLVVLDRVGAEATAKLVADKFNDWFSKNEGGRVRVVSVECFENKKNSSIYYVQD